MIELAELSYVMSRPFVAPPGVPQDRAKALQVAFLAVHKDPNYLAEAVKINDRLRQQVREKRAKLDEVMADLEAKARRYRELARRSKTPG